MFQEVQFVNGFIDYYNKNELDENDSTLIFDQYVKDYLIDVDRDYCEYIVTSYGNEEDLDDFNDEDDLESAKSITSYVLFDKFYDTVLALIQDDSDSDSDIDYMDY